MIIPLLIGLFVFLFLIYLYLRNYAYLVDARNLLRKQQLQLIEKLVANPTPRERRRQRRVSADGGNDDNDPEQPSTLSATSERIPVEREHFIPLLQRNVLLRAVDLAGKENDLKARQLSDLIALGIQLEYRALRTRLLLDFEVFNPVYSARQTQVFDEQVLAATEHRFMRNFMYMMRKGNFRLLTESEHAFGEAGQFQLLVPTVTEFNKMDSAMFETFFLSDDGLLELPDGAADLCNHILVFHRGLGLEQVTGRMVVEKIDALLARYFDVLAMFVLTSRLWRALPFSGPVVHSPATAADAAAQPFDGSAAHQRRGKNGTDTAAAVAADFIERKSVTPNNVAFADLFKTTTIQEPSFKEVVVMFRLKTDQSMADNARAIHIKTFRNIPLADLEIVYPAKKFLFKLMDFLIIAIAAAVGLYFAITEVLSASADPNASVNSNIVAGCTALLGYAVKTYFDVQYRLYLYRSTVTDSLYHKSSDTNRGVILYLLEALEAQEWKETVLAYFQLLRAGGPITQEQLDVQCELLLADEIHKMHDSTTDGAPPVDFEVDDAVRKLVRLGLATKTVPNDSAAPLYTATPLDQALEALRHRMRLYASSVASSPTKQQQSPANVSSADEVDDDDGGQSMPAVLATQLHFLDEDPEADVPPPSVSLTPKALAKRRKALAQQFAAKRESVSPTPVGVEFVSEDD